MEKAIRLIRSSPYIISEHAWKNIEPYIENYTREGKVRKIILLPQVAHTLFTGQYQQTKNHNTTVTRAIALGVVGWTIWTAIDRVRDREGGTRNDQLDDIDTFSYLRPLIDELLSKLCLSKINIEFLSRKIALMEYANSRSCQLSVHKQSVYKSIGVSIPFLAYLMNMRVHEEHLKDCERYFLHLIAAKQLSDDALDWKDDVKNEQHTPVTEWLRKSNQKNPGELYEKLFDDHVKTQTSRAILHHSRLSIKYAKQMTCFTSTEFLEELPRFYEDMALRIIAERKDRNTQTKQK